jgi:hypothetical protein
MRAAKIPKRVLRNYHFLNKLVRNRNSQRNCCNLLSKATAQQLSCLIEIAFNILANNRLPISSKQRRALCKYPIQQLSKSQPDISSKRKLLTQQKGGGPILASILASVVVPLIVEYISNKFTK